MATYKFGQFRKEQYSDYVRSMGYIYGTASTKIPVLDVTFTDIALEKSEHASYTTADESLFLRFAVNRFQRDTNVTIKLLKQNTSPLEADTTQVIANIVVPGVSAGEDISTPVVYDIIISPNDSYGQLVFAIDRDGDDLNPATERKWIAGETFRVVTFGKITNIIQTLDIQGIGRLKQIGVQSRPGLEMCINGEMIRVGRSGIYEINHGIDINFIGFIPDENDHFLMDYQY